MHMNDTDSGSGSDTDEGLNEDMDALRRVFLLTGTEPNDLPTTTSINATASTSSDGDEDDDDDVEDDFELARSLQKRFSNSDDPLWSFPFVEGGDDCEDDINTLRAIQRRFSAYNDDGIKDTAENALHIPSQVGITPQIASEKEVSNNFFEKRNNDAGEEFHIIASQTHGEENDFGGENVAELPLKTSSLPKPALAFIDAIKKNRACQKVMRNKMMQLDARMEEIEKLRERIKILKDFQVGCKKRTSQALSQKKDARVQLISTAKQRPTPKPKVNDKKIPAMCYGPPENPRAAAYKEALTRFPISVSREKWSKKETENLAKGFKQQFQNMLLQQSNKLHDVNGLPGDACDPDPAMTSIKNRDMTLEDIRLFLPQINWEELSSLYVPGRSGAECQARWLNWENPLINHNSWTTVEEKTLLRIVQRKGMSNWIAIAESLGTSRTAFQCLAHFQRSLNASIIKREWSKDEDGTLRAAVEEFGESQWQVAASVMEGRTGTQCSNRWKKTLHPSRKKSGKWSPEEDKQLKVAVKLFGTKWCKIAKFIPGRMQSQCRERWVNKLDPCLNLDIWTAEEDLMLGEAIKEIGYSWSMVAARVPRRTDNQCRRRWMTLFPEEVPLLREAKRMQKAALISNFVDRESRRPDVGPNDFLVSPALDQLPEPEDVNPSVKKKKKIFRKRQKDIEDGTLSCNPGSGEVPSATKGKGSRRQKRKSIAGDANGDGDGDGTTVKKRSRKLNSNMKNTSGGGTTAVKDKSRKSNSNRKKSKCSDTAECHSSATNNKVEGHDDQTKIKYVRRRRTIKPCSRNESADLEETNAKLLQHGENEEQNDIPEWNSKAKISCKLYKKKRSKVRNGACSSKAVEAEEDNMVQDSSSAAGVSGRNRPKRLRTRDETSPRFCTKSKKRRSESTESAADDFSNKKSDKTRTEELEIADDDMTLADFCKKFKHRIDRSAKKG